MGRLWSAGGSASAGRARALLASLVVAVLGVMVLAASASAGLVLVSKAPGPVLDEPGIVIDPPSVDVGNGAQMMQRYVFERTEDCQ